MKIRAEHVFGKLSLNNVLGGGWRLGDNGIVRENTKNISPIRIETNWGVEEWINYCLRYLKLVFVKTRLAVIICQPFHGVDFNFITVDFSTTLRI